MTGSDRKPQGSRRPKRVYLPLAAFLADFPPDVDRVDLTVEEIEAILGEPLPSSSRFPFWWRNDESKTHSRAWLTAGWIVSQIDLRARRIHFERRQRRREA